MKNIPVGQYMVQKGLITDEQLQEVLKAQKENRTPGKFFGDYVIELGYVSDVEFAKVLAERMGVEFNEETAKYDAKGNLTIVYLKDEVCGFALHLVKKK